MVPSWCTTKSTLLSSGALLPFSWLGQGNGTWGLSRGHPASWAVLLVLSVLCSCQMRDPFPKLTQLPPPQHWLRVSPPFGGSRALAEGWGACCYRGGRWAGAATGLAQPMATEVRRAEFWPAGADHEPAQPEGKCISSTWCFSRKEKNGMSFLSVSIVCASPEGWGPTSCEAHKKGH